MPTASESFLSMAWTGLLLVGIAGTMSGCGSPPDHVACYPVQGKVLIGEQPTEGVIVRFYNAKNPKDVDAAQPYGTTDASGTYTMSTFEPGDGAPADDYIVVVIWPDGPPGPGSPNDRLGNAFTNPDTTPLRATVKAGDNTIDPIRIDASKIKKSGLRPGGGGSDPNGLPG